ncbi:fimbrial protein [Paraherbaspirillum soli]|uniref:Fimbrial protein n=1 Tax=Paraherbaspirillum soli TaxID=631222 RepID=A0ABW0MEM4_9BURK
MDLLKRNKMLAAAASLSCMIASCPADAASASMQISGSVYQNTCAAAVVTQPANGIVRLGSYWMDQFVAQGGKTAWRTFTISLSGCTITTASNAQFSFDGPDTLAPALFALAAGSVRGVAIELRRKNAATSITPKVALAIPITAGSSSYDFEFDARYRANGAQLGVGRANANVPFSVSYN